MPAQNTISDKWDARFLALAHHVAGWSKDPSTQVGAVIVRPDKTIASMGYNGFPRGVEDTDERLEDRDTKYKLVVHAETNAIVNGREPLHFFTMYCSLPPCSTCAALIVQSGIFRVVAPLPTDAQLERWGASMELSKVMFREADVIYREVCWNCNCAIGTYGACPHESE